MPLAVPALRRFFGRAWPYILLTLATVFISSNHILGRAIEGHIPPIGLSFWRWTVAALILLPFVRRRLVAHAGQIRTRWPRALLLAFCLVILGNTAIYIGLQQTTAINAGVVSATQPAFVLFLSWLLLRETVTWAQALGLVTALGGVLVTISRGDPAALLGLEVNAGDLWILLSVVGLGFYAVLLIKMPSGLHVLVVVFLIQVLGAVMLAPFYLWETLYVRAMPIDWLTAGAVFYVALVVSNLGVVMWNIGTIEIGAGRGSMFLYVRLMVVTIAAMLLLDEVLEPFHGLGFSLIIGGVWLVTRTYRPSMKG